MMAQLICTKGGWLSDFYLPTVVYTDPVLIVFHGIMMKRPVRF